MRQDKDRGGKWLLTHHGDAVLRLGGITGFTAWKPLQAETVAPRRLPDGLLEVRFPGEPEPTLVLVEIETYPDAGADRQVLDDLMLIAVDRRAVPEVVSLVLKPKGNVAVTGASERASPRGRTRVGGSWPVVRLWEQDAEALLSSPDVGMIPWAPLARTALPPDELLARCRDRIVQVPDPGDRVGLLVVTEIFAGLVFPGRDFNLFRGPTVLDKIILQGMREEPAFADWVFRRLRQAEEAVTRRAAALANLEVRFGTVPVGCAALLEEVYEPDRLKELHRLSMTCPDIATFMAALPPVVG